MTSGVVERAGLRKPQVSLLTHVNSPIREGI